ncbi:MAG: heavy metal-binding domain-containing protein [Candidatus Micrarchaeaceae archaeon]
MSFTSDLSTSDFWLLKNKGYEPLALVVGNSVYSMGVIGSLATGLKGMAKGELGQITELMYNARMMALGRMTDEANKLGADGIIGVKLKIEYMHNGEWMEVTAIGTAIKYVGGETSGKDDPTVVLQLKGNEATSVT